MDSSLFGKYKKEIEKQKNKKQTIIELIQTTTGVHIEEGDIEIKKTEVSLHLTSNKRSILYRKQIKTILQEHGYSLK
jgi:translation initiation factor IF-3